MNACDGRTPAEVAAICGCRAVLDWLVGHGGVPGPAAEILIGLGADPGIRDARFRATPLGWAEHFGRQATAGYLRPLTPGET